MNGMREFLYALAVERIEVLEKLVIEFVQLLRIAEWRAEGGHWEEAACPWCYQPERGGEHSEDCGVPRMLTYPVVRRLLDPTESP